MLSELKLSHDKKDGTKGKKQPLPAIKKKMASPAKRINSASSTLATMKSSGSFEDSANSSSEVESPNAKEAAAGQHRRQHGKLHTTRVEFLLKKYLQDPSDALVNGQPQQINHAGKHALAGDSAAAHANTTAAATLPSPRLQKRPENFNKRATKSIMQVKGEQDAAVRALQHAPRQFYAKPIPLEVAAPRLEKPTIAGTAVEVVLTTTRKSDVEHTYVNISPRGSISAKSVPPSTTEPRYALLVADSVLRRYSAGNQTAEERDVKDNGLQKWMSCPAGSEDQNEAAAHLQSANTSPLRPQSARPRRRSQSPVMNSTPLPDIVEEMPEQLKEFY